MSLPSSNVLRWLLQIFWLRTSWHVINCTSLRTHGHGHAPAQLFLRRYWKWDFATAAPTNGILWVYVLHKYPRTNRNRHHTVLLVFIRAYTLPHLNILVAIINSMEYVRRRFLKSSKFVSAAPEDWTYACLIPSSLQSYTSNSTAACCLLRVLPPLRRERRPTSDRSLKALKTVPVKQEAIFII